MQDLKAIAKEKKIAAGSGTELESEQADEEFGVTPVVKRNSTQDLNKEGISQVQVTLENKDYAEKLLSKLFRANLVADGEIIDQGIERMFMKYKKEIQDDNQVKMKVITSNARVPAVIRFIQKNNPNDHNRDMAQDIVASALATGSKDYVAWVQAQTTAHKKGDSPPEAEELLQLGSDMVGGKTEFEKTFDIEFK